MHYKLLQIHVIIPHAINYKYNYTTCNIKYKYMKESEHCLWTYYFCSNPNIYYTVQDGSPEFSFTYSIQTQIKHGVVYGSLYKGNSLTLTLK